MAAETVGYTVTFESRGPIFDRDLRKLVAKASRKAITKVAHGMESDIKRGLVPSPRKNVVGGRASGHLSRGVRAKVISDTQADVRPGKYVYGADVPYMWQVEYGRKVSTAGASPSPSSQRIRPRKKGGVLRFKPRGSSKYIYRRSTRPYLKPLQGTHIFSRTQKRWDGDRADDVFFDELRTALEGARL